MREYIVNRPDPAAMTQILEREQVGPSGMILRLAWLAGLSRDEIAALTWAQVDLSGGRLVLPDRTVPLEPELCAYLERCRSQWAERCPFVVFSGRHRDQMQPESISRAARRALDQSGQGAVRLMDLRHDWIIRQLAENDWPTVARISGVEVPALQARFAPWAPEKKSAPARKETPQVDEFALWKVLQAEKDTPAGLALWLAWQLGLQAREIAALTWDQVDFSQNAIVLPDRQDASVRTVPLTNALRRMLEDLRSRRSPDADPHVLLTVQSHRPVDLPRLSRLTRAALIRGGMEHVLLRDLRRDESREDDDARLLAAVLERGNISRGQAMDLLGLSKTAAYARLRRLTEQQRLVRVGGKYYLPGTVVPPERHAAAIRAYLERSGFAYRQDIAELLRIEPKQCALVLKRLVEEGTLVQLGQKYVLPQEPLDRETSVQ